MSKTFLKMDVYEAANSRIRYLFDTFDKILVAFSGGKDSAVCLNLCYEYAKKNGMLKKLCMYHLDYEAQYRHTTEFVERSFSRYPGIDKMWFCVPIAAQCACSLGSPYWFPWRKSEQNNWVRKYPRSQYLVTEDNSPVELKPGETDYSFQDRVSRWHGQEYGKTAVVIGIRATESLRRYVAVSKSDKVANYDNKNWLTVVDDKTVNAYPIYDWCTEDIWIANARNGWDYNKLYDLFYMAGVPLDNMRVASPFNDCATANLKLYKVIDPGTWAKMVGRVNGVNFTAIYGDTTAMGWKSIVLPKVHTWKSYYEFLLSTMDEKTAAHYNAVLRRSMKYWNAGGTVNKKTVPEIMKCNSTAKHLGPSDRYKDREIVRFSEYPDDLDCSEFQVVPSYKRMCICIMKNDYFCKYAGFGPTKEAVEKRHRAIEKYSNL